MSDAERQDRISALERKLRNLIQEAVDDVRSQIEARLEEQSQSMKRLTDRLQVELPATVLEDEDLSALAPEPEPSAAPASNEFLEAVRELDRGRTQEEVLDAFIRGARRFSSRAALFLLREDEIRGWRGVGFDGDARDLSAVALGPEAPEGWEAVAEGRGWTRLDPSACGHLCSRLEVPVPREALLVPLVLRDRVAAALYADRLDDAASLDAAALQALTYLAALSLETLSVRRRAATPTLWRPEEGLAEREPLPLWGAPAARQAPAAEAPSLEPEPVEAGPPPPAAEPEPSPAEPEPPPVEPPPAPTTTRPEGVPAAPSEEPTGIPRETVQLDSPTVPEEHPATDYWQLEEEPAAPELEETSDERLIDVGDEPKGWERPVEPEPAGLEAGPAEPEVDLDSTRPDPVGAPREEEAEEEDERPTEEPPPAPTPAEPAARATTEVQPPPDMTGPGRAVARSPDESAAHEEAKRLARLLVSEIKLYNEEEVQEGRRKGDLYPRLKDDIDRSREMYEERIDPSVRGSEDYFHRELVRILADGNEETLGLSGAD